VDLYETILAVIDLRSFSNLWFWIALAVLWSSASHWVIGVPYDMIIRARRHGGEAEDDLQMIVGINVRRILNIIQIAGPWIVMTTMFMLSVLVTLAVFYRVEFAQAVLCLFLPMLIVLALSVRTARIIHDQTPDIRALYRRLTIHRISVQGVGMLAILITSMWGMWVNLWGTPFM
jgi:hypothetical protein